MVVICDDFGTEFVVREFVVRPLNIMVGRKIFPFVQNPMISYCHVWWREGKVNTWDLNLVVEPRASFPIHGTKRSSGWWFQPLWKILVNWDHYSQYMEKKNVPNHQPVMVGVSGQMVSMVLDDSPAWKQFRQTNNSNSNEDVKCVADCVFKHI